MKKYFTKTEKILWCTSVFLIILFYFIFDRGSILSLCASLIGVTSLILNAKGNPAGQVLMVVFSILYGFISYTFRYYGEMLTYIGMTLPMSVTALVMWLKNPFNGNKAEVKVNRLPGKEYIFMGLITATVTVFFGFILKAFNTANFLPSTLSVTTSFAAVYLTARRSPWFALMYAENDIVLIVLWVMASFKEVRYISVVVCFAAFLVNDIYGFINWRRIQKRQQK